MQGATWNRREGWCVVLWVLLKLGVQKQIVMLVAYRCYTLGIGGTVCRHKGGGGTIWFLSFEVS